MRKRIVFPYRRNLSTSREGFGSFHSEDVEKLIRKDNFEYPLVFDLINGRYENEYNKIFSEFKNDLVGDIAKRHLFHLDSSFTFLNHGAFGGVLKPIMSCSNEWRNYCESQPLKFFDRDLLPLIALSMQRSAKELGCSPTELFPLVNATSGLNSIINSIPISEGGKQEVACLSLTYGSTKKILKEFSIRRGIKFNIINIPLPILSEDELIHTICSNLSSNTKLIVIDAITSNTALRLPVVKLSKHIKEKVSRDVKILVDGAHSLFSQNISIDEDFASHVDYFLTNTHKWLCNSKGAGLLWIAPREKRSVRPSIISHGFNFNNNDPKLLSAFSWDGCRDYSPLIVLPLTFKFWHDFPFDSKKYIFSLLENVNETFTQAWKLKEKDFVAPLSMRENLPMSLIPLPSMIKIKGQSKVINNQNENLSDDEAFQLQEYLHHNCRIEVPIKCQQGKLYVRVSVHIYNKGTQNHRNTSLIEFL